MTFAISFGLEMSLGVWSFAFGRWAFLGELVTTLLSGFILRIVEGRDDEHYVPSAIEYYLSRPWRTLYSAGVPDEFRGHRLEWLLRGR